MKSATAKKIKEAIEKHRPDLSCAVYDNRLYTIEDDFPSALKNAREFMVNNAFNVNIMVVSTSGQGDNQLILSVEPALPGASILFNALQASLNQKPEDES